jgi:hypothetical protein
VTCATCPFYYAYSESATGECRRRAPVIFQDGTSTFPGANLTLWCGEHPEREAQAAGLKADALGKFLPTKPIRP